MLTSSTRAASDAPADSPQNLSQNSVPDSAHSPSHHSQIQTSQPIPPFSSTFPSDVGAEITDPSSAERLQQYLDPRAVIQWDTAEVAIAPLPVYSQAMLANAYYFGHPRWGKQYFNQEHRGAAFRDRWHHALNRLGLAAPGEAQGEVQGETQRKSREPEEIVGWNGKVVVDLGCGPGNLFATLGGEPTAMIGVDISLGALRRARQLGYLALLADAHHLPLRSQMADVVVANALLHHCDDVARVLAEAARLVKPGGFLITDLDPQRSAWERWGWGLWLDRLNWPRLGWGDSPEEMAWRIATEIHNRQPGVGLETSLYHKVLEPLGFEVHLYPHHCDVGAEVFVGDRGRAPLKVRWAQQLSGLNPNGSEAAQSILCIAQRITEPRNATH